MYHQLILTFLIACITAQIHLITIKSPLFHLLVLSRNKTINGSALYACHKVPAVEGLCTGDRRIPRPINPSVFNFNTSSFGSPVESVHNQSTGILVWVLPLTPGPGILSSMSISLDLISNVAQTTISPGYYTPTEIGFDGKDRMYVEQYLDDAVVPPVHDSKPLYR